MRINELLARLPSYPLINRYFTLACTALPAAFGSLVSLVYHSGAIWCAAMVLSGRQALSRDRAMLAMAAVLYGFVAINYLSTLVNGGPHYVKSLVPVTALLGFPFSYSIWAISKKTDIAWGAIVGSAFCCLTALALALIQFFLLGMRAEGGAGNALVFGTVVALATSISFAGLFAVARRWAIWLGAAVCAGALALIFSGSRIAWFAAAAAMLAVCFVHRRELLARLSPRTIMGLSIGALLIGAIAIIPVSNRVERLAADWKELQSTGNYGTSLGLRAALWNVGIDLVREGPVMGHGQAQTAALVSKAMQQRFNLRIAFSHLHNGFLTAAVETGLSGALILAGIFAVAITIGVKALRRSSDTIEIFGALMLLAGSIVYLSVGSANIMLGHDILDTVFLATMAVGIYLSSGRSLAKGSAG